MNELVLTLNTTDMLYTTEIINIMLSNNDIMLVSVNYLKDKTVIRYNKIMGN